MLWLGSILKNCRFIENTCKIVKLQIRRCNPKFDISTDTKWISEIQRIVTSNLNDNPETVESMQQSLKSRKRGLILFYMSVSI